MSVGVLFTLKTYINTIIRKIKEMSKIAYVAPEMEVIKLKLNTNVLLDTSMTDGPAISDQPGPSDEEDAG